MAHAQHATRQYEFTTHSNGTVTVTVWENSKIVWTEQFPTKQRADDWVCSDAYDY